MKELPVFAALLALVSLSLAGETKPLLHEQPLPLLAAPGFAEPLDDSFSVAKGSWTPKNGVLSVLDLPPEQHIPELHHNIGLADAVIEVEFFLEGRGSFLATPKSRSWLAAGKSVKIRDLKISGVKTKP